MSRLLKNLDPCKAHGPHEASTYVLKEGAA